MNNQEAILEMKKGNKVAHEYFVEGEYITMSSDDLIIDERGVTLSTLHFWECRKGDIWKKGWFLFEHPKQKTYAE